MNTLSWFIYLANIVQSLGTAFGVFGTIALLAGIFLTITMNVAWDYNYKTEGEIARLETVRETFRKFGTRLLVMSVFFVPLSLVIPDRNTMYMIAASESAGMIVQNEEVKEVFRDLTTIIKQELKTVIQKNAETLTPKGNTQQ